MYGIHITSWGPCDLLLQKWTKKEIEEALILVEENVNETLEYIHIKIVFCICFSKHRKSKFKKIDKSD